MILSLNVEQRISSEKEGRVSVQIPLLWFLLHALPVLRVSGAVSLWLLGI